MMRKVIFGSVVLVAACGSPPPPSAPIPDLGSSTHFTTGPTTAPGNPEPDVPDPHRAFRLAFSNPGGMWMPQQMPLPEHVDLFRKMGVKIDAKTLADPLASPLAGVVSLGGCTGSFVSPEGLIVTNHHCVQGALQLNSDPQHNLVEDGFLAKTLADEKPAGPAQRVMVAQAYTDVTSQMRDGLEEIEDPIARKVEVEKRTKALVAACEKDRPALRCQVASFFQGGLYQLIEMLEIRTCAWSTRRRARSATTAARSTTGSGRATPATGPSTARTSARTASPPTTRPTTCRIGRSTGCRCRRGGLKPRRLRDGRRLPGTTSAL